MSLLDTIMNNAGMPAFRRVLGDEATYTPDLGPPVATWVIFSKTSEYAGQYEDRLETRDVAKLPVEDVPRPVTGGTLTVGSTVYRIGKVTDIGKRFVTVLIKAEA